MALITVIIPVYNAEKHLSEALESLCAQSFSDWECICVNDDSADSSSDILKDFTTRDARFRVINQSNAGPGAARNRGIEEVRTPWFFFLDADDTLHPCALEALLDAARKNGADIACAAYITQKYALSDDGTTVIIDNPTDHMCSSRNWRGTVWGRLYRTAACGDVKFPRWKNHEDVAWSTEVFAKISRAVELTSPLYFYRPSPNSLSRSPEAESSLPKLWRRQAEICPGLRDRLGEFAYANWKTGSKSIGTALLMQLEKERTISLRTLSPSKKIRLLFARFFHRNTQMP